MRDIYNQKIENNVELHKLRQEGTLYREKEEYKKKHKKEFYNACKELPFSQVFYIICSEQDIFISEEEEFVYFIDYMYILDEIRGYQFGNLTPSYEVLLNNGIHELRYEDASIQFCKDYNKVLDGIEVLVNRILLQLSSSNVKNKSQKVKWFENLLEKPAEHFDEAIQRILLVNQIMWQTDHRLIGLGALDEYLFSFYEKDIKDKYLTEDEIVMLLRSFLQCLHHYYWFKSNMLMGDTGQIIVLGGSKINGKYKYNKLSEYLLMLIEELQLPDPKILLRVNAQTPRLVLEKALQCISTGVGSPLLSNDEQVIPALVDFGVDIADAYNYTVSACWEPLIGGKSTSLNNMTTLNYMRSLENLFKREKLDGLESFERFIETYFEYLKRNLNAVKRVVIGARFQYDPILSVFIEGCREKKMDVSVGGAKYMNVGITSVALGNVVDSLLNIKEYVYEKGQYSLIDVKKMLLLNYSGYEKEKEILKGKRRRFGCDEESAIALTRRIVEETTKNTEEARTDLGGKLKFGLSAPTYVDASKDIRASFDGRESGQPFIVHISNESTNSYTEVFNFASSLDYKGNRFNGNVVDLMVSPNFIKSNLDKLISLLQTAIKKGFFQMQMNVISSDILLEARRNPEKFPNLIVRVWGFSSYFSDLPDEYKEVLIKRAIENERKTW
ncbi:MAG: hypothetical protein KIC73_14315 [Clostridiales bacterium]|nr:hypothetical protein [Clostridiales bacterium]